MGIVKLGGVYRVCATCDFWDGPRAANGKSSAFDNKASGRCMGEAFPDWRVGAVSTCVKWKMWHELGHVGEFELR